MWGLSCWNPREYVKEFKVARAQTTISSKCSAIDAPVFLFPSSLRCPRFHSIRSYWCRPPGSWTFFCRSLSKECPGFLSKHKCHKLWRTAGNHLEFAQCAGNPEIDATPAHFSQQHRHGFHMGICPCVHRSQLKLFQKWSWLFVGKQTMSLSELCTAHMGLDLWQRCW